jgi:nucleoside-diphosphate-sugar epimerase
MRVALFGGTGFIGREVTIHLVQRGYSFFEVSRNAVSPGSVRADITDYATLSAITEKADVVIICASALPKPSYADHDLALFASVNIHGIHNILRWSAQRGVTRVIYCSTLSMVPLNEDTGDEKELIDTGSHYFYKATKAAGEAVLMGFCKSNKIDYCVLRIASVYGPGMKKDIIDLIASKIKNREKFIINNASIKVDFIHVTDVARVIVASMDAMQTNLIINVASGTRISLDQLAFEISKILKKKVDVEIRSGSMITERKYSVNRMKSLLGDYHLVDLQVGLKELLIDEAR